MSDDVLVTNIRRQPYRGWMIVLFMVVSFVIGCVSHFFSEYVCLFCHSFFTFLCLWEISFSGQMISGTVS